MLHEWPDRRKTLLNVGKLDKNSVAPMTDDSPLGVCRPGPQLYLYSGAPVHASPALTLQCSTGMLVIFESYRLSSLLENMQPRLEGGSQSHAAVDTVPDSADSVPSFGCFGGFFRRIISMLSFAAPKYSMWTLLRRPRALVINMGVCMIVCPLMRICELSRSIGSRSVRSQTA
jgi:hypothetical protein